MWFEESGEPISGQSAFGDPIADETYSHIEISEQSRERPCGCGVAYECPLVWYISCLDSFFIESL